MQRDITLTEALVTNEMAALTRDMVAGLFGHDGFRAMPRNNATPEEMSLSYEDKLEQLISLARPHLLTTSGAPFSPRPDGAAGGPSSSSGSAPSSPDLASVRDPRSPEAAAEGAIPLSGSGTTYPSGLLTFEGLHDALIACHRDMCEGHFQFAPRDWPGEMLHYIIRHAEQQDETREAAE